MVSRIRTIDAHAGGQAVRLITDGLPAIAGTSMVRKRESFERRADELRRAILLEPRGHANLRGAVLTEPVAAGSSAGVLFLDADGLTPISGHGIVAAATIALERGLIHTGPSSALGTGRSSGLGTGGERLQFDTVAGTVQATAMVTTRGGAPRVESVTWTGLPSFVHAAGFPVRTGSAGRAGTREVRVDIAFGGLYHAIVDTEAIGIPLITPRLPDLSRLAVEICAALNSSGGIVHPADASIAGVSAVTFTSAPQDPEAHLRNVTVTSGGRVNRSPGGCGTMAVMAVLDAMGLLLDDQPFVHESLSGTLFRGRVAGRTMAGDLPAIVAELEGSAWITGEHTFLIDDEDPLREGVEG